ATTRIYRNWVVPGLNGQDLTALRAAASVLGGLSSSRLDNALVRGEKLAVSVTTYVQPFQDASVFTVYADVKQGGDVAQLAKRLDEVIAQFLAEGPTADELERAVTRSISGTVRGFESVGGFSGKATILAQGLLFSNDVDYYKKDLARWAALTPASVKA